jgi:hypothetical protein
MSLKNTIYGLILSSFIIFMSCSENEKEETRYLYYLESAEHLGIEKGTKIFALNYEIGEVTDVKIGKSTIVYQFSLGQENLFFYDTEMVLSEKGLVLDNTNSQQTAVAIGDTLLLAASTPSTDVLDFSLPEKTAVTQQDIDSLQQKIDNLSNLIDELNGNH